MLALPAAALAQSAGDNQYQDPFAGQTGGGGNSGGGGGNSGGGNSGGGGNAGASAGATAQATPSSQPATTSQSTQQQSGATLPRTGFNAFLPLIYGLVLLLSGVALRRGARPRIQ
jgi:hypothetical protein